ncbi:MAG: metalloregulator ArsR/SmtB family transcription factor [Ignavibacteria bacterium]|nr:metalloregulator ArsR/SmtB family transcription factor [Ignavibacteria bacterium]MBI3766419.1 metalloregulator ArsR/SmtB family transcription factor [Ignavibacteriales bacterium]
MTELVSLFRCLADGSRLRLLNLLFESGELCVCDLESILGFTQTKVSRHMNYLKKAGLVEDRRSGRWILYSIAQPRNSHQRLIIKSIQEILGSHAQAQRDAKRLMKHVKDGCCATFVHVKPDRSPTKVSIQ